MLNPIPLAVKLSDKYEQLIKSEIEQEEFAHYFSREYNEYAKEGTVPHSNTGDENPDIIKDFLINGVSGTTEVRDFAEMLADYWSTVKVENGSNNAKLHVDKFELAIIASLFTSAVAEKPYFLNLITHIQLLALPFITWSVGGHISHIS